MPVFIMPRLVFNNGQVQGLSDNSSLADIRYLSPFLLSCVGLNIYLELEV